SCTHTTSPPQLALLPYTTPFRSDYQAVFQLEAQVDVAATPGSKPNGSNDTINPANTAVTGALASRNSYVGIATPFGALKLGKNRSEEHTSELQSPDHLVCRLLLE